MKKEEKEINKGNKKNIKIVLITAGVIILSAGAYLSTSYIKSQNDVEDYDKIYEIVLEQSTEVNSNAIKTLIDKQINEKDYTLNTVFNILKVNPAYIVVNDKTIYDTDKIEKQINKIKNKKYNEEDVIELSWKITDDKFATTYIASDITDEVKVVGFHIQDISLFNTSSIKTNEKIPKTDLDFKDIANLDLTLTDLNEKVGKLYNYYTLYPLLTESKFTENITSNSKEANSVIEKNIVKTEDSMILIITINEQVIAMHESLFNYDNIVKLDKDTFIKISENDKLKEEEFLSLVKDAKLVSVESIEDKNNKLVKEYNYFVKNNENEVYSIEFKDGAFNNIEPID